MFNSKSAFFLFILTIGYVDMVVAQSINPNIKKLPAQFSSSQDDKSQAQYCPKSEDLFKQKEYWVTKDGKWRNYTPSSASNIVNFTGAQWAGIRVGKIICFYQTNEAVAFPLAVEQITSQDASEPSGLGWSSLSGRRRFCKSASVADCRFYYEAPRDTGDLYGEIKYNPRSREGD